MWLNSGLMVKCDWGCDKLKGTCQSHGYLLWLWVDKTAVVHGTPHRRTRTAQLRLTSFSCGQCVWVLGACPRKARQLVWGFLVQAKWSDWRQTTAIRNWAHRPWVKSKGGGGLIPPGGDPVWRRSQREFPQKWGQKGPFAVSLSNSKCRRGFSER